MICVLELYVGDCEDPKLLCERKFDNWGDAVGAAVAGVLNYNQATNGRYVEEQARAQVARDIVGRLTDYPDSPVRFDDGKFIRIEVRW